MTTEIPYNFMPPEQHFCSPAELLAEVEKYQRSREMVGGDERFNLPEGAFEMLAKGDGRFVLMPASRDYAFLFRGQGGFYSPCLPTLLRRDLDDAHLFIERMRVVEFELMLKRHPAVQFFYSMQFEVDYVGLAQHYGLYTDVLDLTSDIRTALFFAMCDYDRSHDCYHPKVEDKEYIGYIYAYPVIGETMSCANDPGNGFLMRDLKVIGLQPFPRPGSQRGFSLHIEKGKEFKGYLYSFSYTRRDSEEYFEEMINRRHVWDKDFIVDKVNLIKDTKRFSFDALALATRRHGKGTSICKIQKAMNNLGIHFFSDTPWKITAEEQKVLGEKFEKEQKAEMFPQIMKKNIETEGKSYPASPLSLAARFLMTQAIQGGEPCIEGYDSGITMSVEDNPPIVTCSFSMNRAQTVPDSVGRVTTYDSVLKSPDAFSSEAVAKRESLKKLVQANVKPFKGRKVFVPKNGGERVYLD